LLRRAFGESTACWRPLKGITAPKIRKRRVPEWIHVDTRGRSVLLQKRKPISRGNWQSAAVAWSGNMHLTTALYDCHAQPCSSTRYCRTYSESEIGSGYFQGLIQTSRCAMQPYLRARLLLPDQSSRPGTRHSYRNLEARRLVIVLARGRFFERRRRRGAGRVLFHDTGNPRLSL